MQSLAPPSVKTTGTGATRLDRDVKRWREEAGQVSDILLRREHDEREARAAAATRMRDPLSTTPQRPTDDRPVCSSTSHRSAKPRDVAWVRSYRPESVGQIFDEAAAAERAAKRAAAKAAREARRAAGRGRDRGETSAAAATAAAAAREGRPLASAWRRARAAVRSLTGARSRAARLAEAEATAAEARRLKEARDARRDGAFDANLVLADELREMDARESSRIRSSAVEFFAAPGETIVAPFGDASAPFASARTRANPHTRANPLLGGSASVPASPTRRESHPRASSSSSRSLIPEAILKTSRRGCTWWSEARRRCASRRIRRGSSTRRASPRAVIFARVRDSSRRSRADTSSETPSSCRSCTRYPGARLSSPSTRPNPPTRRHPPNPTVVWWRGRCPRVRTTR